MSWLGPLLGGIASGGLGWLGGSSNQRDQVRHDREMFHMNRKENRHLLKNQMQWRIKDIQKAAEAGGVSPLALLGMNPASGPAIQASNLPSGGLEDLGSKLGQGLERSIQNLKSPEQKHKEKQAYELGIKKTHADLATKRAMANYYNSLAKQANQAGNPKQTFGNIKTVPSEIVARGKGTPYAQAGAQPSYQFAETYGGNYLPLRSEKLSENVEDDIGANAMLFLDRMWNTFRGKARPPKDMLRPGFKWKKSGWFSWKQVPKDPRMPPQMSLRQWKRYLKKKGGR